jgi:hypothetical protein
LQLNIFVLDPDPMWAARYHCDKHVVKMILESCQMLCNAHSVLDGATMPLKPTHVNHPCSKWARVSKANYLWLWRLTYNLLAQYRSRFQKMHAYEKDGLVNHLSFHPAMMDHDGKLTPFVQAMPEIYKNEDAVIAYRVYYFYEKRHFAKWKTGSIPSWWLDFCLITD